MEVFTSKKWWAQVAGVVAGLAGAAGFDLPAETILAVISPILTYIVSQGLADMGKEAKKVQ